MNDSAGRETRALLERLPGTLALDLELRDAEMVTRSIRRLHFTSEALEGLNAFAGQDLMLSIPQDEGGPVRRRYTIRHLSQVSHSVDLDLVLHGEGPGARWASGVARGDRVEAIGPRGKIGITEQANWHLFWGDLAALPAICEMIEALPASARAAALLCVEGPQDHMEPEDPRCHLDLEWLEGDPVHEAPARASAPAPTQAPAPAQAPAPEPDVHRVLDALRALSATTGPGHAYVFGELNRVASVRAALVTGGLDAGAISQKAYWRRGRANAAHGEPERTPAP